MFSRRTLAGLLPVNILLNQVSANEAVFVEAIQGQCWWLVVLILSVVAGYNAGYNQGMSHGQDYDPYGASKSQGNLH